LKAPVGIVGAGLIGRAWAIVFARAGHAVAVYDADPDALATSLRAIDAALADLHRHGLLEEPPAVVRDRIAPAATLADAVRGAGYVQESVRETVDAKLAIFAAMDSLAAPDCILASSTSYIPASAFSANLPGRARCLVAHPVNPPHIVPVVELCPAPWTTAAVVERARCLHESVKQVPVVVRRELPGFILNRLQAALVCEAMRLFEDGYASAEDIDRTIRDGLGLRWALMGPMETIDLNAPGGVVDYAARYAATMVEMDRAQTPREWSDDAVRRLEAERRERLPAERLAERTAWRDRRLMALVAHKRAAASTD
jgi:3-hydroxyacyl-CoA dehydrogenase